MMEQVMTIAPTNDGLSKLEGYAFRLEKWICIASLAVMVVAISASVMERYFNLSFPNPGELAVFAMAPLTFIGAAMCSYTGTHIAVDVIKLARSAFIRRIGRLAVALSLIIFAAVYLYTGARFFMTMLESGERGLDMGTPIYIPTFFLPLGMALMLLHAVAEIIRVFKNEAPAFEEQA